MNVSLVIFSWNCKPIIRIARDFLKYIVDRALKVIKYICYGECVELNNL